MFFEWYHWAIMGIVLILLELAVPVLVLVWFGIGALFVAAMLSVFPDLSLAPQLFVWTAASLAMVFVWFKLFKPSHHRSKSGRSSAEAVGEIGLLISEIEPFGKAKVRFQTPIFGADVWECISDEYIPAGSRVKVVSVEGSILKIEKSKS